MLVVATLLDLLTPELLHNVDRFLTACQTYEGGFACSTYATPSGQDGDGQYHRAAMAEAHGGYTSCSLNSFFLLDALRPAASPSLGEGFPSRINVGAALRWSVLMQGEAIEAGGFRGRSNKLVDGCYSWWVGGGIPVLEELARQDRVVQQKNEEGARIVPENEEDEGDWEDVAREHDIAITRADTETSFTAPLQPRYVQFRITLAILTP